MSTETLTPPTTPPAPQRPLAGRFGRAGVEASVIAVLAVLAAFVCITRPGAWEIPAGLLLALVLPGMAVTRLAFPGRRLAVVERLVLVPALSLAVLALGGLLLFVVGVKLAAPAWSGLTAAVTLIAATAGWLRRRRYSSTSWATAETTLLGTVPQRQRERLTVSVAALRFAPLLAIAALLGGAFWLSTASAANQEAKPFTALSVVPTENPDPAAVTRGVVIAVGNHEGATADYRLRITGADGFTTTFTMTVRSGSTWIQQLTVPNQAHVTLTLYKGAEPVPYRMAYLSGVLE